MIALQPALPLNAAAPAADTAGAARIDEAARQLEGQFARMLIGCMREAGFGDALFPGESTLFRDLYDRQIADAISSGQGLGLAPMIARQLGGGADAAATAVGRSFAASEYQRLLPAAAAQMLDAIAGHEIGQARPLDTGMPAIPFAQNDACAQVEYVASADTARFEAGTREHFVASVWPHAQRAAQELGVDPRALVAQAALETGWGRRALRREDGGQAHNLFGIKATGWQGARARAATHEYVDGVRRDEVAEFRAYASPAESFADYVRLLKHSPRYRQALAAGTDVRGFADGLQRAGYATDPAYASKIAAIAAGPSMGRAMAALGDATTIR